jgi:hypothetical protein
MVVVELIRFERQEDDDTSWLLVFGAIMGDLPIIVARKLMEFPQSAKISIACALREALYFIML